MLNERYFVNCSKMPAPEPTTEAAAPPRTELQELQLKATEKTDEVS